MSKKMINLKKAKKIYFKKINYKLKMIQIINNNYKINSKILLIFWEKKKINIKKLLIYVIFNKLFIK